MAGARCRLPPRETRADRRTTALVSAEEGAAEVVTSGRSRDIHFATLRRGERTTPADEEEESAREPAACQRRAASAHIRALSAHTQTHTRAGCLRNVGSTNGRSSCSQRKRSEPGDNVVSACDDDLTPGCAATRELRGVPRTTESLLLLRHPSPSLHVSSSVPNWGSASVCVNCDLVQTPHALR